MLRTHAGETYTKACSPGKDSVQPRWDFSKGEGGARGGGRSSGRGSRRRVLGITLLFRVQGLNHHIPKLVGCTSGGPVGTSERKGMNLETESEMLFPGCERLVPAAIPPQEHRVCDSQRCGASGLSAGGLRQRRALLRFPAREGLARNNLCVSWPARSRSWSPGP